MTVTDPAKGGDLDRFGRETMRWAIDWFDTKPLHSGSPLSRSPTKGRQQTPPTPRPDLASPSVQGRRNIQGPESRWQASLGGLDGTRW